MFTREQIVEYEPPRHLAYTLVSGMPVNEYRADVVLEPDGAGTVITWEGRFQPRIPGTGRLFAAFFRYVVSGFARRLGEEARQRL